MFTAHYRIVCVVLICIAVCASLSLVHTSTPPSKENYATPNDSLFVQQWNLKTGSGLNGINAIFGWDIYTGNSNVIVGVLEDGIQMEHPDFDPTRMYGDDVPSSAHGTMVAGIIAAKANNGRGTAGIDWACKIQWYNKFPDQNLDLLAEQIDSISAAHITNCSWGKNWSNDGNANSDVYISFIDLYNRNILNVAGQGPNAFPEEFPYGTLRVNGILKSSNSPFEYNQNPDVVAPTGTETATPEFRIWAPTSGGGYSTIGETSAATPHVTGVAAMLLGFAMSRGEVLYADDLAWLIKRTAQPRGGAVPDPTFGYGLVDLNGALRGISQGKVVNHYSAVGTVVAQQDLGVMEHSFPHIRGLSDDVLVVEMYTVEASFDLNATFVDNPAVWTRPAQSGTTKSGGGNNGWKHVDLTETSPKVYRLRGYVYHLRTILGGVADPEWWPAPPGQAVLAMSAWGEPALVAPVEQVALSPNYHKVNLQWNDPNRNETGIFIQRRTSTGNWTNAIDLAENSTTHDDATMMGSTAYYYRSAPHTTVQTAPSNEVMVVTKPSPPTAFTVAVHQYMSGGMSMMNEGGSGEIYASDSSLDSEYVDLIEGEWLEGGGENSLMSGPPPGGDPIPYNKVTFTWATPTNQNPQNPIVSVKLYLGHYESGSNFVWQYFTRPPSTTSITMCLQGNRQYTARLWSVASDSSTSVYATFPNTQFVTGPEMCPRDDVGDPGGNKLASETESQIEVPIVPDRLALNGNAPNPFNAGTSIRLNVALPGQVHVDIFDVLGRRVRQLVSSFAGAGAQSIYWDGQTDAGKSVGTGVYFYRVNDGVTSVTSKMMVIK